MILGPFNLVLPNLVLGPINLQIGPFTTAKYLMLVTEASNYKSAQNPLAFPVGTFTFVNNGTHIPDAPSKDPSSTTDYGVYWANWLAEGETIANSEWTIPDGLTSLIDLRLTNETKVMLTGGTSGTLYTVTNRITTSRGRTEERSMYIMCEDR